MGNCGVNVDGWENESLPLEHMIYEPHHACSLYKHAVAILNLISVGTNLHHKTWNAVV